MGEGYLSLPLTGVPPKHGLEEPRVSPQWPSRATEAECTERSDRLEPVRSAQRITSTRQAPRKEREGAGRLIRLPLPFELTQTLLFLTLRPQGDGPSQGCRASVCGTHSSCGHSFCTEPSPGTGHSTALSSPPAASTGQSSAKRLMGKRLPVAPHTSRLGGHRVKGPLWE